MVNTVKKKEQQNNYLHIEYWSEYKNIKNIINCVIEHEKFKSRSKILFLMSDIFTFNVLGH